jgi:Na+-translocating ferredoxin:NAD+ oxidoreductase subunit B
MASTVTVPLAALIDEQTCIGCALCIPACPVDAILGAPRLMHTVIASECTGCGLCLLPCPVDCIRLVETGEAWTHEQRKQRATQYRRRHAARRERLERERSEQCKADPADTAEQKKKQAAIERAMQRARERLLVHQKKS